MAGSPAFASNMPVKPQPTAPAPPGSYYAWDPTTQQWATRQGTPRGNVAQEIGNAVGAFGGAVGGALGLTPPNTAKLQEDTDAIRGLRTQYADELARQGERAVPGVSLERTAPAERVSAPTLSPTERATAATAMAAPVSRVGPTQAASIGPAERATAGYMNGATIATGPQGEARGVQQEAIDATRDVLTGKAPSVAELQAREQLNRNVSDIQSQAAGARGLGAASARRNAARNMARAGSDALASGQLARAQEVATARGQLGGLATDTRGQDIGLATNQAGLTQDASKFNAGEAGTTSRYNAGQNNQVNTAQAGLTQQAGQNDADRAQGANLTEAQLRTGVSTTNANNATGVSTFNAGQTNTRQVQQGQMDLDAATGNANRTTQNNQFNTNQANTVSTGNADRTLTGRQMDDNQRSDLRDDALGAATATTNADQGVLNTQEAAKGRRTDLVSNLAKSGSTALAASDEDLKKRIKTDPAAVEQFLREVKPISFEFKSSAIGSAPAAGPGRQLGVKAQDVDDSSIGRQLVVDGPGGKALDQGNALGPILAALSHMNDKLNAVTEKRRQAAREMG